jgi:hypothetical protein
VKRLVVLRALNHPRYQKHSLPERFFDLYLPSDSSPGEGLLKKCYFNKERR